MGQILQPTGIPYSALVTDPASTSSTAPATPAMVQGAIADAINFPLYAYAVVDTSGMIRSSSGFSTITITSSLTVIVIYTNPLPDLDKFIVMVSGVSRSDSSGGYGVISRYTEGGNPDYSTTGFRCYLSDDGGVTALPSQYMFITVYGPVS